mgnify:CR=1 FL=1
MINLDRTLFVDGFELSILGTTDDGRIIYSKSLMVQQLILEEETSFEDAMIALEFNVWNAYVGDFTPIYVNDFDSDLDEIKQHIDA